MLLTDLMGCLCHHLTQLRQIDVTGCLNNLRMLLCDTHDCTGPRATVLIVKQLVVVDVMY
jgi:hypothetical protein